MSNHRLGVTRGTLSIPSIESRSYLRLFWQGLWLGREHAEIYRHRIYGPIMMMMDDHILFEANADLIQSAHEIIQRPDVGCVRLVPWPGPTLPYDVDGFGEIDKSLEYAVSLQASFWKPQTLRDILDPRWSPWEVELKGARRRGPTISDSSAARPAP